MIVLCIGHHCGGEVVPLPKLLAMEQLCEDTLGDHYIGCFSFTCRGFYRDVTGELLKEPCSIIVSLTPEVSADGWAQLKMIAAHVAFELRQECVLLGRFGRECELCFVTPSQMPVSRDAHSQAVQVLAKEETYAA